MNENITNHVNEIPKETKKNSNKLIHFYLNTDTSISCDFAGKTRQFSEEKMTTYEGTEAEIEEYKKTNISFRTAFVALKSAK